MSDRIRPDAETMLEGFDSKARYNIHRAIKDGVMTAEIPYPSTTPPAAHSTTCAARRPRIETRTIPTRCTAIDQFKIGCNEAITDDVGTWLLPVMP